MMEVDTRVALMRAAQRVFSQKGFKGATVKDIAEEAKVNVSLVSYYFEGKEGLYRACVDDFGRARLKIAENILTDVKTPTEFRVKLKIFVEQTLQEHFEEEESSCIVLQEMMTQPELIKDVFKETVLKIFDAIVGFVTRAHCKGILKAEADPQFFAAQIWSTIIHSAHIDRIRKDFFGLTLREPEFRARFIDQLLLNYLDGALASSSEEKR